MVNLRAAVKAIISGEMRQMPKVGAVRIAGFERGAPVTISVDGQFVKAHTGEMLAASLLAVGIYRLRSSPTAGTSRGAFCLMGVCQECLVRIDGRLRQACMTTVRDGLVVTRASHDRATG